MSHYCCVIEVTCYGQDGWHAKPAEMLVYFWAVGSDDGMLLLGLTVVDLSFLCVANTTVPADVIGTF